MVNFETTGFGKKYVQGGLGVPPVEAVEIAKEMEEHNALEKSFLQQVNIEEALRQNKGMKANEDVELQATGYTVIYLPYGANPFRTIKTSESGLIIGGLDIGATHKSNETGELENGTLGIK